MTDQTAPLRDRIAAALYDHSHPGWAISFPDLDQDQRDTYLARADAVLAVLPATVDRAAILREAIARVRRIPVQCTGLTGPVWFGQGWKDAIGEFEEIAERWDDDRPLSPYYEHPECGFHWHGRDGMDIPVQEDGQPVCPRCELAKVQKKLDHTQKMRDEVGVECKRRGKRVLEQSERVIALERQVDEVQRQLGAEILRVGQAEAELRRVADETAATETQAPAAAGLPAGTLEAAEIGANRLDAWARSPQGRNFLAHALVQLARTGWLRPAPGEPSEPKQEDAPPAEPAVTMHAIPLPGSNGVSACCGRPPCEFVGERVTRDPDKVTCSGPAAGARQDGAQPT
ncbi:hypothetical protein AB0E06_10205 [Streptomyces sp. NPDC048109]|uniref:hypothetical protein n=1 Tax=Streptomyces sp. NPDC048109 TaxID=3155482 RepID=UPI0034380B81